MDPARSELLWVAGYTSREEIASRLFGDTAAVGAFDFEPRAPPPGTVEGLQVCVRVRQPPAPFVPAVSSIKGERSPERILAALGIPAEWFRNE